MLVTSQFLPPKRNLEIEIKNWAGAVKEALISNGFDKEIAERIAVSGVRSNYNNSRRELIILPISLHLVPKDNTWAVISQNGKEILFVDEDYNKVLVEARIIAKKNKLQLIFHASDGWERDAESFQVNRPFFFEN